VLVFTHIRNNQTFRFTVTEYAVLQERKWFFGYYWATRETTNSSAILDGWIRNYFDSEK
jgi:hypothetical protein